MSQYMFGMITAFCLVTVIDVLDRNVPNSLWYYIDLYLPF